MADRNSDIADPALDELRRKARRRLVGAIVLALAAAIILPMLLENDPRSLGDDVSVQIPPVGEGKFINRLTGKTGDAKGLPKADTKAEVRTAPGMPEAKLQPAPQAASSPAAETPAAPAAPASASGTEPPPKKSVAEAEQRVLAPSPKSATKAAGVPVPPVETKGPTAAGTDPPPSPGAALPASTKVEGFVVQLAAFSDDKGANSLANKLKRTGYAAFVEPVQTSRGTLWRVRVGGYGSRAEADAAREKLKGEGYSGIVAPVT